MKYERCPNCNGKLKIPDKKRGQPVECPVCELEFVPALISQSSEASSNTRKSESRSADQKTSARGNKLALRSLPIPTSIGQPNEELPVDPPLEAAIPDPMLPPVKSRLDTMAPGSKGQNSKRDGPPSPPASRRRSSSGGIAPAPSTTQIKDTDSEPAIKADDAQIPEPIDSETATDPDHGSGTTVARIIKTESVQPLLTKEGKLPTLHLKDDVKPVKKETSLSSNPLFVGLLVCASLVASGMMLLMFSLPPSENQKTITEARNNIKQFYEVRSDEELKPFQIELREAQLAHSRGDRDAEIKAYQTVMARFHAEDRNPFTGLTGSPTWDIELEDLVSILLKAAKREKKSFLD